MNVEQIKRFILVGDATDIQELEWAVSEIERLRAALDSTLPAVEEMIHQAATRQKDHWHKILVEASK